MNTYFVCFTNYDETMPNVHIAFKKEMLKVPNIGILKATKVVGGENVDDVIKRAIKFKQKRNKIYIYDDKEENTKNLLRCNREGRRKHAKDNKQKQSL